MSDPAPPERLRACPPQAETALTLLLHGVRPPALLAQWLRQLQCHEGRVPSRSLPQLLEMATRQPTLRAALLPVLGERGHWLAARHDDWSWARRQNVDEQAVWDTGSLDERIGVLGARRARDPEAAVMALSAAWKSEPPEQRAALLSQLAVGLGPADEPFLEAALDDRRKEVRTAAQRLLTRLPGSQLSRRMQARLLPLLHIAGLPGLRRLDLTLPAERDAVMQRDGVGAASHAGVGEKAGWVIDMLAAVDPRHWSDHFARSPRDCLTLATRGDAGGVLLRGWTLAAARHAAQDAAGLRDWIGAIARTWIEAGPGLRNVVPHEFLEALAATSLADAQDRLAPLLDAFPRDWFADTALLQLLNTLVGQSPLAWPAAPSRAMLQLLGRALSSLSSADYPWLHRQLLTNLALVVDPSSAIAVEPAWLGIDVLGDAWRSALAQFFDTVRFRHTMTLSFQEPA